MAAGRQLADGEIRVVDSDVVIDYLRNSLPGALLLQEWLERDLVRFGSVTALELRIGTDFIRRSTNIDKLLRARTLPLDHAGALLAGEVFVKLRGKGLDIGVKDSLLAGTCLRFGLPLATRNTRHFKRVEGLRLIGAP